MWKIEGGRAVKTKPIKANLGLVLRLVLIVAEGAVQQMPHDNNDDQQDHEDHGGVGAVGGHLLVQLA